MTQANQPLSLLLRYFAILREQSGRSEEHVTTNANTPYALYEELSGRYPFTLPPERVRVAVNDTFVDMDKTLNNGDSVVFVPPVAGG